MWDSPSGCPSSEARSSTLRLRLRGRLRFLHRLIPIAWRRLPILRPHRIPLEPFRAPARDANARRHPNDGQRARLRGDDRETDAPPGNVAAAEEVVARVALVMPEPHAQADDAPEVGDPILFGPTMIPNGV